MGRKQAQSWDTKRKPKHLQAQEEVNTAALDATSSDHNVVDEDSAAIAEAWTALPTAGLSNLGNTCFFSSALQCLYKTRLLHSELQQRERSAGNGAVFLALRKTLMEMKKVPGATEDVESRFNKKGNSSAARRRHTVCVPNRLLTTIQTAFPFFDGDDQHDAHELLYLLLGKLDDDEVSAARAEEFGSDTKAPPQQRDADGVPVLPDSAVNSIFSGQQCSRIECRGCGAQVRGGVWMHGVLASSMCFCQPILLCTVDGIRSRELCQGNSFCSWNRCKRT